jgi:hypothetical protein
MGFSMYLNIGLIFYYSYNDVKASSRKLIPQIFAFEVGHCYIYGAKRSYVEEKGGDDIWNTMNNTD